MLPDTESLRRIAVAAGAISLVIATGCGETDRVPTSTSGGGTSSKAVQEPGGQTQRAPAIAAAPTAFDLAEQRAEAAHPEFVRGLRATVVGWCDTVPPDVPLVVIETMATIKIRAHSGGVEVQRDGRTFEAVGSFYDPATRTVLVDADLVALARGHASRFTSLAIACAIVDGFAQAIEHEAYVRRNGEAPTQLGSTARLKGALVRHYLIPGLAADSIQRDALDASRIAVKTAENDQTAASLGRQRLGRLVDFEVEPWSREFLAGFRDGVKLDQLGR